VPGKLDQSGRRSRPGPLIRIDFARQWYVNNAYNIVAIATAVNRNAEMKAARSPKFNMPMARAPRITVKFIHDRKVRSLAKKTLGSTRVGRAIRLPLKIVSSLLCESCGFEIGAASVQLQWMCYVPGAVWRRGWLDILTLIAEVEGWYVQKSRGQKRDELNGYEFMKL
jgi:hypothetical protein